MWPTIGYVLNVLKIVVVGISVTVTPTKIREGGSIDAVRAGIVVGRVTGIVSG